MTKDARQSKYDMLIIHRSSFTVDPICQQQTLKLLAVLSWSQSNCKNVSIGDRGADHIDGCTDETYLVRCWSMWSTSSGCWSGVWIHLQKVKKDLSQSDAFANVSVSKRPFKTSIGSVLDLREIVLWGRVRSGSSNTGPLQQFSGLKMRFPSP